MDKANSKHNYGFILRSKNKSKTGIHSDILIESPLLSIIKKIIYKQTKEVAINPSNRLAYILMRTFLTKDLKVKMISLLPDLIPTIFKYETFINDIVQQIMNIKINSKTDSKTNSETDSKTNSKKDQIIFQLYEMIKKECIINSSAIAAATTASASATAAAATTAAITSKKSKIKLTESIIKDFVINPAFADIYIQLV